jgi:hypothetical protein
MSTICFPSHAHLELVFAEQRISSSISPREAMRKAHREFSNGLRRLSR